MYATLAVVKALREKLTTLEEAVKLVKDDSSIAFSGIHIRRHPMAFVRQLVKSGVKNLTVLGWNNGMETDMLIGAGLVKRVESSYVGLAMFGLAPNFRRAVERGEVEMVEYTESASVDRFRAGWYRLTFFPTKNLFGSDIPKYNKNIREVVCPFTGKRYHALPAAVPDVTILHAHAADKYGNILYDQRRLMENEADTILARAAERVIVTVEETVSHDAVLSHPYLNLLPRYFVDAVVEVPFGAHPTSCDYRYELDADHLRLYAEAARTPETFRRYLDRYVYGPKDHFDYLEAVGGIGALMKLRTEGGGLA